MYSPRHLLIAAALLLITIHSPCAAQNANINASFNEIGTQRCTLFEGGMLEVYVVAYELTLITGYEFELTPSYPTPYFLGKEVYGIDPLDFGEEYEVRAGTGGCVAYPTMMGPSPDTWTLARFELGYFAGVENNMLFCVDPSPSSGASTPQYTLCDQEATLAPFELYTSHEYDQYGGCALANPAFDDVFWFECLIVSAESPSWGALKAQYGR